MSDKRMNFNSHTIFYQSHSVIGLKHQLISIVYVSIPEAFDNNRIPYIFSLCYTISDLRIKHWFSIQLWRSLWHRILFFLYKIRTIQKQESTMRVKIDRNSIPPKRYTNPSLIITQQNTLTSLFSHYPLSHDIRVLNIIVKMNFTIKDPISTNIVRYRRF